MNAKIQLAYGPKNPIYRRLQGLLEKTSFQVVCTEDIDTTLSAAVEGKPDLLLMDLFLPRFGAFAVKRALRKEGVCIQTILSFPIFRFESQENSVEPLTRQIFTDDSDDLILTLIHYTLLVVKDVPCEPAPVRKSEMYGFRKISGFKHSLTLPSPIFS